MSKYEVEKADYGMKLAVRGFISPGEVTQMNREIEELADQLEPGFGVVVDMRANRALSNEAVELMKRQIAVCMENGMSRGAVVLQSAIMTLQARRLVTETGLGEKIRFIDASSDADWEKAAVSWAARGAEPPAKATGAA